MGKYLTPPSIPPTTYCRRILIPNSPEWVGTVTGALYPLIFPSAWEQVTGITPDEAADRAREMFNLYLNSGNDGECGEMACCPPDVFIFRVNPDTGQVEQSADIGVTWKPAANTLSSVIVNPIPPVTSGLSATKCDAATNLSGQVNSWISQVTADFDTASSLIEFGTAVFEAILAAVLVILSAGLLSPIEALVIPTIGAALLAAWSAGKAVFEAYWTTDNKDKILCAAFLNIGDDGSFTDSQFAAFWNQCNSDLPASPAKMLFMGFLSSIGTSGLNAMAATGIAADADCGSCGDDSCATNTNADTGNFDLWTLPETALNPDDFNNLVRRVDDVDHPTIFLANGYTTSPFEQIGIIRNFDPPCFIASIHIDASGSMPGRLVVGVNTGAGMALISNELNTTSPPFADVPVNDTVTQIQIQYTSGFPQIHAINFV